MIENWKPIPGYEKHYEISDLGRVRSLTREVSVRGHKRLIYGQYLNPFINARGYMFIDLRVDGARHTRSLHRLVAEIFIPNPKNKRDVNHKDGDKKNNAVSNLEWSSHKENMEHAIKHGLVTMDNALTARRRPVMCTTTGDIYASATEAAKMMGINRQSISRVAAGSRKSIHGYHFKFAD